MKFLLLGHGGHGKGTVANLMWKLYNCSSISSSIAGGVLAVFPVLKERYGYPDFQACYDDRYAHRQEWFELIAQFNTPDKTRLSRQILFQYDGYDGMRSIEEFNASRHLYDVIFYVDASERIPPDLTMQIPYDKDSMVLIDNNGSPNDLRMALVGALRPHFGEPLTWRPFAYARHRP